MKAKKCAGFLQRPIDSFLLVGKLQPSSFALSYSNSNFDLTKPMGNIVDVGSIYSMHTFQSCPWGPFAKRAKHTGHVRNNTTSEQTNNFDRWMLLENLLDVVQLKQQKWQILSKYRFYRFLSLERGPYRHVFVGSQGRPQRKRHFIGHILENLVLWRMHPHQRWDLDGFGGMRLGCCPDLGTVF